MSLFFLRKDEVITLQPFVLLSFFQRGGVSLCVKHSPCSFCFVMPEDGKIILTSFFCSYINLFRMTAVLWDCVKTPLLLSPSSSLLPDTFIHLQRQMKPKEVWCVLGAKFISNVDEARWGIMSWLPKTIKPRPWGCRLKWCCSEHHHNLERPSLAERRESSGPLSHSCADSAPCWSSWKQTRNSIKADGSCWAH